MPFIKLLTWGWFHVVEGSYYRRLSLIAISTQADRGALKNLEQSSKHIEMD